MSEVIGDTSALHTNTTPFKIVVEVTGASGSGSFTVGEKLQKRIEPHGLAELIGGVTCSVSSPPAADKAATVRVAVIPSSCTGAPTTAAGVASVPGSVLLRDSIYATTSATPLIFGPEVSHFIKPAQLVGSPPKFVYHYAVEGAETSTVTLLEVSGTIRLEGVGFVSTW